MLFNLTKVVVFGFYWALRLSVVHCENDGQVVMIWKEEMDKIDSWPIGNAFY